MMRARSNEGRSSSGAPPAWLCISAVFFAACSSAPLADENAEPGPTSPSAAGAGSTPSNVDYKKREYPPGPYGTGEGSTLENFGFLGWRDPVASGYDQTKLEQVQLSEFYDPTGSKGIKLIWINASAVWCSVCRAEMRDIKNNGVRAAFEPRGVQLIVTLFEDNKSGPARPLDLHNWGSAKEHAIDFPLLLDPGFKLGAFFTSDATPLNMLVDARTMRVLDETMGYSSDYWEGVDKLLAKL